MRGRSDTDTYLTRGREFLLYSALLRSHRPRRVSYVLNEYEYHSEVSPASPASPAQPHLQAVDLPPSNASKTVEKIIAFAICLPNKIDASRFSGPEQFFACAPYVFLKKSNVVFRRRIDRCRCLDRSRCSKTIENGRKNHSVRYMFA